MLAKKNARDWNERWRKGATFLSSELAILRKRRNQLIVGNQREIVQQEHKSEIEGLDAWHEHCVGFPLVELYDYLWLLMCKRDGFTIKYRQTVELLLSATCLNYWLCLFASKIHVVIDAPRICLLSRPPLSLLQIML